MNYLVASQRGINSDLQLTFDTVQYSTSRLYIFFVVAPVISRYGKIGQPFYAFDFKRYGEIEKKMKGKGKGVEGIKSGEEFHRDAESLADDFRR